MKFLDELKPVQLVYSLHELLIDEAIGRLKSNLAGDGIALAFERFDGVKTGAEEILAACRSFPLGVTRKLVVVSDYEALSAQDKGHLADYIKSPVASTVLVLCQAGTDRYGKLKVDRRGKLFKAASDSPDGLVYEYKLTKGYAAWLNTAFRKKGKMVTPELVDYMLAAVGHDLWQLKNEVDKLCVYFADEASVDLQKARDIVTYTPEAGIFELVDSVALGAKTRSLAVLGRLLVDKDAPGRVFYMLERQFRLILRAKGLLARGTTESELARQLNLHPFVTKGLCRQGRRLTWKALKQAFNLLAEADLVRKTTGTDPNLVLEQLVVDLAEAGNSQL